MFTYKMAVPLDNQVHWSHLRKEADRKLTQITGVSGQWVNCVEPWKFYNWIELPEGHVSWQPSCWFEGGANDEASASMSVFSSIFGRVEITMTWWYVNDQMDQALFTLSEPPTRPLRDWEVVLTIAVGLAIAEMTGSGVDSDDGLCGLGRGGTVEEVLGSVRCRQNHESIQTAVQEVLENIRANSHKRGIEPLFDRVGVENNFDSEKR